MRTRLPMILLLVAVVLIVSISRQHTNRTEPATDKLVVLSRLWSPPHEKDFVINEVISQFETQNNCNVDFQSLDDDSLLKRAQVQQETRHVSADVVIVYVSRMREWVDNGYVCDLTPYIESWTNRTFSRGFTAMTTFSGRRFFAPIGADDYLLCADKRALKYLPADCDLNLITWQQLADWSLAIAQGEGRGKFAFTGVAHKMLVYQIAAAVLSYGGTFPDIASPAATAAWQLLAKMRKGFAPSIRSYDSVVAPMKRGEAWVTVTHSARAGEIYTSSPTRFVIAPPPSGPAGRGSVAGVSGLAVLKGCAHHDLAIKFIEYITQPETQLKLARGTGGFIPTVNETIAFLGDSSGDKVIKTAIQVLDDGLLAHIPPYKDWDAVKQVFDESFNKLVLNADTLHQAYLDAGQHKIDAAR